MASALFILIASIGSAFVQTWHELLGFRLVLGLGMGCKAAIVPVFAAEVAPAPSRGELTDRNQSAMVYLLIHVSRRSYYEVAGV